MMDINWKSTRFIEKDSHGELPHSMTSYMASSTEADALPEGIIGVEREIKVTVSRGGIPNFSLGYMDDISYNEGDTRVLVEETYPGEEHDGLILQELVHGSDGPAQWIQKWDAFQWKAHKILESVVTEQMEKELEEQFKKELIHGV